MNKEENSNEVNNEEQQSTNEEVEEQHSDVEEEVKEQHSDGEEEVKEQHSDVEEEVKEQHSDVEEEVKEQQSDVEEEVKEQQSDGEEVEEQKSDGEEVETHNDEEEEVEVQHNGEEKVEEQNESTNNEEENINEKTKKKKNNKKESKPKKEIKPKFSYNCLKCNKLFKNESLYNKHTLEQVCYKNTELTYCKICNITLTTHNEYKTHLFSLDHINQIGCNTLEKINKPNDKTIHSLDPYLNKNEVKNISSNNLGSSFTFVYETGSTQTVSLINNETHNETHNVNTTINTNELTNNNDNNNVTNNTNEHTNNNDNSINTIIIPEPTLRQTKIINFLEKQILDNKPIQDSGNLFYKMLDNKLQIDDYKNLQKIITHLNINNDYKKTYLDTINLFISFLVKEKTNRKTIYKDKDISQLVINLTS